MFKQTAVHDLSSVYILQSNKKLGSDLWTAPTSSLNWNKNFLTH